VLIRAASTVTDRSALSKLDKASAPAGMPRTSSRTPPAPPAQRNGGGARQIDVNAGTAANCDPGGRCNGAYGVAMNRRSSLLVCVSIIVLAITGCGAGSSHTASPTTTPSATTASSASTAPSATTVPSTTTGAVASGAPTCPTTAQADAALGVSDTGPVRIVIKGGGVLCEYTGAGGNSAVAIYAHQNATVFAGMVSNADDKLTGMQPVSGVGNGAYFLTAGGRSVVNAYSNGSHTVVAAQGPGGAAPVEALAKITLADN
jgi:hypothetical protein